MKTSAPHSTLHIRETLIRRPELIEQGLTLTDTDIPILDEPPLDLIGQDAEGVLALIVVRDEIEGERRRENGGNVVEDATFFWHFVTDFREDYMSGVRKFTGRKVKMAPPRLLILAPGFSGKLIELASFVTTIIELELYEFDPDNVEAGFRRVELPSEPAASAAAQRRYIDYHGEKMEQLSTDNREFFDNPKTHPYQPVTEDELTETVEESLRESFRSLRQALAEINGLRPHPRPNRIALNNPAGLRVCELVVGPGGGYTTTVYDYSAGAASETKQRKQFSAEQRKDAVKEVKEALKTFPG